MLNRFRVTGMFRPPFNGIANADTGSIYYRVSDSTYLGYTGNAWRPISGGNEIDVFLIGGQSNAMGAGDSALSPKVSNNVLQVVQGQIKVANDPVGALIGASSNIAVTGSAWPAFGNAYYNATGKKIAFVPSARDGSSQAAGAEYFLGTWDTTGVLFDSAVARINSSMATLSAVGYKPTFRGVLWCQGEADGKAINRGLITQSDYIAALKKMIGKFRNQLNYPKMPFYIFRTGTKTDTLDAGYKLIRDAQQTIANIDTFNTKIVFYNAIDFPQRGLMSDVAHFIQAGYNEMGSLSAAAVVSGRVFNIDDVLITENNKLRTNRTIDLNNSVLSIKNNTTDYFTTGSGRNTSNKTHLFNDSISQLTTSPINLFRGKSYFGSRSIEGTEYAFFGTASLRSYDEESISGNPSKTAGFMSSRYLYLNDAGNQTNEQQALYSTMVYRVRGAFTMSSGTAGLRSDLFFTRAADFVATPTITGPTDPLTPITSIQGRTAFTNAGAGTYNGWYSSYQSNLQLRNAAHAIQNYADIILGSSVQGNGATLTNRYGIYIGGIKQSWVTNAYSIYQLASNDTNYFGGKIRTPNLVPVTDSNLYKPQVVDAAGNHYVMAGWPGGGGGNSIFTNDGTLTSPRHISGGVSGNALQIDSTSSITLFSGLEYISSGIGSFIQMSDSVMNIGSSSATDFTSFTFSPTRIKFTAADGAGTVGDVWTNTGSGYGHWAPGSSSGITSINSNTGPAVTIQGGTGVSIDNSVPNYVTVQLVPGSSALMHPLIEFYTDANNTGTSATDLYSYTLPPNTLAVDGQKLKFEVGGDFNDATATCKLDFDFDGNAAGSSGVLTISSTGSWKAECLLIRTGSSTARVITSFYTPGATVSTVQSRVNLTGLNWSNPLVFKIYGTAGGGTGGSNDITAGLGYIMFIPIPI